MTLRVLDLFSGIGGFSLGLERTGGFETVAFCEIEEFPRRVLAKHWPNVPIHRDVRELKAEHVGAIDVICGGYPCQPFSLAGQRRGAEDDRHLWPEMRRLVDECRPAWVIGENVVGHIGMGLDDVLSDLDASGYSARAFDIPAVALDAKHRRHRVWIVANARGEQHESRCAPIGRTVAAELSDANAQGNGRGQGAEDFGGSREGTGPRQEHGLGNGGAALADANGKRGCLRQAHGQDAEDVRQPSGYSRRWLWQPEPNVGRVAHGVPARVDRLRGLGNAVVPQIPEIIGRAILAAESREV